MFTLELQVKDFTAIPVIKCVNNVNHKEAYLIKYKKKEILTIYGTHSSEKRSEISKKLQILCNDVNWKQTIKKLFQSTEIYQPKKVKIISEIEDMINKYGVDEIEKICIKKRMNSLKDHLENIEKY